MSETILFDRDDVEHLDDIDDRPRRLSRGKLLWVDVDRDSKEEANRVAEAFGLDSATQECLADSNETAVFKDHGRYIHVTTYAPDEDDEGELIALECVVGENWVITAHDVPIPVLEEFSSRVSGSGDTGSLDGPGFLAALLEWVLGAYSAAFERIEQRLEEFDIEAMRGDAEGSKDIERLIDMRKEVGKLRRALAAHRSALVSLTHPELEALGDHASSERYQSLLQPLRVDGAGGARRARGHRRLVRRSDRPRRAPDERDHEGADAHVGDPAPGRADRRRDGDELQGRSLRGAAALLGGGRGDRAIAPVTIGLAKLWKWI